MCGLFASTGAAAGVVSTSTGPRIASSVISGVVSTASPRKLVCNTNCSTASGGSSTRCRWTAGSSAVGVAVIAQSTWSTARNASCGISTLPTCFMRFFPSFCFSRSLRLREMSPP